MQYLGWWVAGLLAIIVLIQAGYAGKLRRQIRQAVSESAHLANRLSRVQEELAEVNARRKKLLAASTQALLIVESDFTVSSANKVARRLFGKKQGKDSTLMTWTRQHQLQELVEKTLQGEKMPPSYFVFEHRSLEAHARVIRHNRQRVAVALAVHDVTELQRLTRIRRDFVANISHELRTPVTSIQLLAETLRNGAISDKKLAGQLVKKIAAQADTLSQLAQELMDLSMIESGQAPLKLGIYSLLDIAQAQIERMQPQAERKHLQLHAAIPPGLKVLADETMLGRAIGNLLHNGIKFTEKGHVTIAADPASISGGKDGGDWVTVSVTDTGVGMPPAELDRVFERFYKVDQARSRKKSGTGLGLAIARHVIEAHGGSIWAKSDGYSGATIFFTLPLEEYHAAQPAALAA